MNARLFQRVRQVKEQAEAGQLPELSEEDLRMTDGTFEGFERSGACLPDDKKARFREISMQMSQLSLQFSDNNLKATNDYQLHITDESKLSGLPDTLRKQAAATAQERGLDGWVFTLQSPSYGPFMTYAHDRELRRQMYYASILRCTEHSPTTTPKPSASSSTSGRKRPNCWATPATPTTCCRGGWRAAHRPCTTCCTNSSAATGPPPSPT